LVFLKEYNLYRLGIKPGGILTPLSGYTFQGELMALNQKVAYIDLTKRKTSIAPIPVELRMQYIGGRGLNSYLLFNHLEAEIEPLGPENVVVVGAGLLGGMLASASGWTHIVSKSPLTGFLGGASLGEFFAPELRWAGFDHLVIKGKATEPSFIFINDGRIEIRDASSLWGKDTWDTQDTLKLDLEDEKIQILCIGQAGEKLVRFAGISTRFQNAGGSTGIGAVFGSKNLKAIVVKGTKGIDINSPEDALEYDKQIVRGVPSHQIMERQGYNSLDPYELNTTYDTGKEEISIDESSVGKESCFGCQLRCRQRYTIEEGEYAGSYVMSPGYLNLKAWNMALDSGNVDTILMTNHLVNIYGLDPLETSCLISWVKELYAKSVLTEQDTEGLELDLGSVESVKEMIHLIGRREGLGNVLAEGCLLAAKEIGGDSEKHLFHKNGISRLQFIENLTPGLALETVVSISNPNELYPLSDFTRYELTESEIEKTYGYPYKYKTTLSPDSPDYGVEPWQMFWRELYNMTLDMLGLCQLHSPFLAPYIPGFQEISKMVYLNTGLELSAEDLWGCADRAYTIERLFNIREGYTGKDDWVPDYFYHRYTTKYNENEIIDREKYQALIEEYYKIHEWDVNGAPGSDLLTKLRLDKEPSHKL